MKKKKEISLYSIAFFAACVFSLGALAFAFPPPMVLMAALSSFGLTCGAIRVLGWDNEN